MLEGPRGGLLERAMAEASLVPFSSFGLVSITCLNINPPI
jgi:hypothetical protein